MVARAGIAAIVLLLAVATAGADEPWVRLDSGQLHYRTLANGDRIPDFSHVGYMAGEQPIPDVPVRLRVVPGRPGRDDTDRIQQAIDTVAQMPRDAQGFRGTVLLQRGRYEIHGRLRIAASGIVLRGEGAGPHGTQLIAIGKEERALIVVAGSRDPQLNRRSAQTIVDEYVPVGAHQFTIEDARDFAVGDAVFVRRRGNAAWISAIGMDRITPRPSDPDRTQQWRPFTLSFDRVITAIDDNRITIDAPIVCSIDQRWGGGDILKYDDAGRIDRVGVEYLSAVSEFDPSITETRGNTRYYSDENHASRLVSFNRVKHAWARHLHTQHFTHGGVAVGGSAKWITIEDCRAVEPVSQLTGSRRYPFHINGQLILVQRCYAQGARHAFAFGARVTGPNVFVDCESEDDYASSEPHHRWSVGGLYDNVTAPIAVQDRQWMGTGHGWAGANYVLWNCRGDIICQMPPTAHNWAIGIVGRKRDGAFSGRPDGHWQSHGHHVEPRSLYHAQLETRLGRTSPGRSVAGPRSTAVQRESEAVSPDEIQRQVAALRREYHALRQRDSAIPALAPEAREPLQAYIASLNEGRDEVIEQWLQMAQVLALYEQMPPSEHRTQLIAQQQQRMHQLGDINPEAVEAYHRQRQASEESLTRARRALMLLQRIDELQ